MLLKEFYRHKDSRQENISIVSSLMSKSLDVKSGTKVCGNNHFVLSNIRLRQRQLTP